MKKNILCIDDSKTALLIMEYALDEAGFQAILAESVEQAIQIIKKQVPDLILLDLSMPEISGFDFLKLRKELKLEKVPIIVVSAYDSPELIFKIKDLGAIDFVSKPINITSILEKIRTLLNQ